jgi:hypothetical protein
MESSEALGRDSREDPPGGNQGERNLVLHRQGAEDLRIGLQLGAEVGEGNDRKTPFSRTRDSPESRVRFTRISPEIHLNLTWCQGIADPANRQVGTCRTDQNSGKYIGLIYRKS